MTRKLRPCGTQSAYRRHLNRGEEACAACKAANTARTNPGSPSALRVGEQEWAKALEEKPPVVVWRRKNNGVYVHVSVYDPHPDGGANKTKTVCQWGHPFDEANTLVKADGSRQCRACRSRENAAVYAARKAAPECTDENLLAAGTREI